MKTGSRPELLAPAGSPEALRAALDSGADAVYLGWGPFHARQGARNFDDDPDRLAAVVTECHFYGVRVYLTLNTLVTDRELPAALEIARTASRLGVDAVLVQDWGLLTLLRETLPDLPLHASTQMSLFTTGGATLAAKLGMCRIVLARECSREDIAAICRNCPAEIEVFVHGALCQCYSGQCAMSALIGGRSGNRGRCAQPCRLPCAVGRRPDSRDHALSLKDVCLADAIPELTAMGVACVKLEGRMKRAGYVATVTGIYATLLRENRTATAEEKRRLEAAFSRSGFTDGYWQGKPGADMFGTRPSDGADLDPHQDPDRARDGTAGRRPVPVSLDCRIRSGKASTLTARDEDGHTVTVTGAVPEPARTRPLTERDVADRLRKTGGSGYVCGDVQVTLDGIMDKITLDEAALDGITLDGAVPDEAAPDTGLSLSAAALNGLRRSALAALTAERTKVPQRRELPCPDLPEPVPAAAEPALTVSVSRPEQLVPELQICARIALPLDWFMKSTALPIFSTTAVTDRSGGGPEYCVILPRIWRDREEEALRTALQRAGDLGVTGVLVGNLGHIPLTEGLPFHRYGDFGLNVTNGRSILFFRDLGLESVCLSFELRSAQIRDMVRVLPTELIVCGRLPLMITEQDLLPPDSDPDIDPVLIDRTGAAFPLLRVPAGRTELENSRSLYLADRPELRQTGVQYWRLRFTTESPQECVQLLQAVRTRAPAKGSFTRGLFDRGVA